MAQALPSGTVTFLFTDIEGSTQRWEEWPYATAAALARHDAVLRDVVASRAGVVFAHTGDGVAAAFRRAGDATEAAVDAQCALTANAALAGLRVRMALHTGEAEERDGNYFGPALNRAARLLGVATGGQVLVSLATAELVRDRLRNGLGLVEVGERKLRSLSRPERVFELHWPQPPFPVAVEVQVLGPLRLLVDGVEVAVPGPRRRAVLALLAMAAPGFASTESLLLGAWKDRDEGSNPGALQNVISRLRGHLGAAAPRLQSGPGGYRLQIETSDVDAGSVAELLARARRTERDPRAAIALLAEARRKFRGPPLEEFIDTDALAAWGRSLQEQRLAAADLHAERAIAAGDLRTAMDVAAATVAEEPLREGSVRLLMQALAADGRSADALRAAHRHRRLLAEQAGLRPSPILTALEQAVAAGTPVPSNQPPAPAAPVRPRARQALIGRETELAAIGRLCRSEPLVTLHGPGGVGKTSLALEVAARDRTGRQVTTVQLAPIDEEAAVTEAVAHALGLRGTVGDPLSAILTRLESTPWLLVLDNCEHLLRPVRRLVEVLTASCPELTVLATSRRRLGSAIEQLCPIAPLPVPADDQSQDLAAVPAVAVFVTRASRARPGFQPDDADLSVVAGIVRRLDGMPLAIELAAGRMASLGLGDLAGRLDRSLDLLAAGVDRADDRHATLRTAIEWSYDLLTPEEQRLFRALSVFPDGFDLATAEQVARAATPALDPTHAVAQLAEASMLATSFGPTVRYRMLDTLRAFGLDRLAAHDEHDEATSRFLHWVEELLAWIDRTVLTEDEPSANERLLAEFGNIRAAWHWAKSADDLERMVAYVLSLYVPAAVRDLREVWLWTIDLSEHPALANQPHRAVVLAAASTATARTGADLPTTCRLAERAAEELADHDGAARTIVLDALSTARLFEGRLDEAITLAVQAAGADTLDTMWGWAAAGYSCAYAGRFDDGRTYNAKGSIARYPSGQAMHHYAAGEIENAATNWAEAQRHYEECIRLSEQSGATFFRAVATVGLVTAQASAGDVERALVGYAELIDHWEQTGAWVQQWTTLRNLAELLDQLHDETAAVLRAAAETAADAPAPEPATAATHSQPPHPGGPTSRDQLLQIAREAIRRQQLAITHGTAG